MHARDTVAGVEKAFEHLKLNPVFVREPFERGANRRAHRARHQQVRAAMIFVFDIACQQLG